MLKRVEVLKPVSLLLVRLVVGMVMIGHGWPKLVDTARYLESFPNMGVPAWTVYPVIAIEVFGGALLIAGLFTRIVAFVFSGEMFVTFLVVHWKMAERGNFGFLGKSGDEHPLALCVTAFLLFTLGAGALSLDRLLFKEKA
jgi:putative oxidoreductase